MRNLPNINPNGAKFDVPVHAYLSRWDTAPCVEATLSGPWRRVMAQVGRYIEAGFAVEYEERYEHGRKFARIVVRP